jgi:light-regulated signal transduction histidine kinase (bacteriophytochrome)
MSSNTATPPAFGEANFSNCEREQVHLAGSIQPHGALLVVDEPDLTVIQASANAADMLQLDRFPLGLRLADISEQLELRVRMHLDGRLDRLPVAFRCSVGPRLSAFDGLLHRPPSGGLIVELEPAQPHRALVQGIGGSLKQLMAAPALQDLCDEAARMLKALVGYDRVMVYRFDEDGHGQVFSEQREPDLEPYLGNRYPASDIPRIARDLYKRNRVRLLVDVGYEPVPLEPRLSPLTGRELDMSLCALRSMSPIHTQYLKNMGVAATLVVSLMAGDRLWGLIACHHYRPRFVSYQVRALCELLGEAVATRIAALEGFVQVQAELLVRRLEQRMIEAISRDGDWKGALFDSPASLLNPMKATGAALLYDGELTTTGEVPATGDLRSIARWLDAQPREPVIACSSLGEALPELAPLCGIASGVMAVPLSVRAGEYLLWLRPEQVRTLTWGGNPFKSVVVGSDPGDLSPRSSFAKWHQLVEGTSEHWSASDRTMAQLIGESVADVIQQFRAVRVLIAQHQLERIQDQVCGSTQPTAVFGRDGATLMLNDALARLLPPASAPPATLDALAQLMEPRTEAAWRLEQLRTQRRSWRGEIGLRSDDADCVPLLVRADPVLSTPSEVLGYVVLLTDVRQRQRAERARQRFQSGVLEPQKAMAVPLESREDLLYRNLFASLVQNAQLAALEIADGVDLERVPDMLDGVQASVSRTAELLEHLIWYERRSGTRRH